MIPLFKSHFSIGKSILTIPRIFELSESDVVIVDDSLSGIRSAMKESEKTGKELRFGLKLETRDGSEPSKLIYFAKGPKGIDSLRRIYTKAFTKGGGIYELNRDELIDIQIAVPFYDSYVSRNLFNFGMHDLSLEGLNPWYFEEDNHHPFDFLISKTLKKNKIKTIQTKSVCYEKKEDFAAFQFYKAVCERKAGKQTSYERPNLEHFCSDEFCLESALTK